MRGKLEAVEFMIFNCFDLEILLDCITYISELSFLQELFYFIFL